MTFYHYTIFEQKALRHHSDIIGSGFLESDKTAEEVKELIENHNRKKGRIVKVYVNNAEGIKE